MAGLVWAAGVVVIESLRRGITGLRAASDGEAPHGSLALEILVREAE